MARLVIIDDESHITDIIARFFREKGHEVLGFTRADEALAHLKANSVDLVITDIAMKGLSGLELLKKMKTAGVDVPVIVTRTTIDRYYFNDSLVRFFQPNDEKSLAEAMLQLIENPGQRQELVRNAREFIQGYTWERNKGVYLDLVDSLLGVK